MFSHLIALLVGLFFVALAAALATGGALWAAIPSVATKEMHGAAAPRWHGDRQVLAMGAYVLSGIEPATSDAETQAAFARGLKELLDQNGWALEIGDGPGQVELAKTPEGKWRTIYYDSAGQARFDPEADQDLGPARDEKNADGPRE